MANAMSFYVSLPFSSPVRPSLVFTFSFKVKIKWHFNFIWFPCPRRIWVCTYCLEAVYTHRVFRYAFDAGHSYRQHSNLDGHHICNVICEVQTVNFFFFWYSASTLNDICPDFIFKIHDHLSLGKRPSGSKTRMR